MEGFLGRYSTYIYAILRIVSGFLFIWHGSQKLFGYPPAQLPPGAPPPEGLSPLMAVGGTIEFVGGILIMIGLFTSFAAFISSGMMAVAYFMAHFSMQAFLPLQNRGELAVIYCFVFLYIASRGSGVWSVESVFKGSGSSATGGG
jgi:putative oxidoreductase